MKANVPEKIYLSYEIDNEDNKDYIFIDYMWHKHRFEDKENAEYIRKDAFIEKACEWLRTHSEDDYFELIPDANYCGAGTLNKKRMVEDFRKYIKGE